MMEHQPLVIAIDGPAASGKSTVGLMLANRLGCLYLDTGSMYRALTLAALERGVPLDDETALVELARQLSFDVKPAENEDDGRHYTVLLDGRDVTWALRSPSVDGNVSAVSSLEHVREEMVAWQRRFARRGCVIMVGRDIGTVVLPDAPLKLYITASAEERARRRWRDRQEQGNPGDFDAILADIVRRDDIDSSREHSPLRPAADSIMVDTTDQDAETVVDYLLSLVEARRASLAA